MAVLTITMEVNAPSYMAQAVKEALAMYMERFGDTKVISITDTTPPAEQMSIGSMGIRSGFTNGRKK